MYKNVQVNHYNNATNTTTTAAPFSSTSSPSSSFPSQPNQTATTLPVQITGASSSSFSSSTPNTRPAFSSNSNIGVSKVSDGGISLPVSFNSANPMMSSKLKSDVDQLDDLVKDLLIEVNRPLGLNNTNRSSNNNNNKHSTSSTSHSYHRRSNHDNNNEISNSKLPSSIRASSYTQASTFNNQKRNDFDANAVSGLIDGSSLSSNGVHREEQRSKSTREERIRIKRGGGGTNGTDIPITTSSSMTTTTTTTNKPSQTTTRDHLSIDEQLIDSLLESVQNTLKKRSQQQQSHRTAWTTTDIPIHHPHPAHNRRTYSSSAAYTDSVHRMDPMRGRFPIKLGRTDSPTSTLSLRRPYSRQDHRDGYQATVTSASTTAIPTHFRATSEPPPDGPLELRRMDLVRSPSRTQMDGPPNEYYHYSRSTLPAGGIRVRGHDYSGYETDTGLVTARGYGPRYYGGPPPPMPPQHVQPPPPMNYPYYPSQPLHYVRERQHDGYSGGAGGSHRSMLRPDGYDTDSGLISSGRLRMTRTLPPRMAAIPETLVVNNRMVPSSNLHSVPNNVRGSSFLNETSTNSVRNRTDHLGGYETDSGMHIRQQNYNRRQVPVDIQYGDSGWVGKQPAPRPVSQQQQQQQQRFVDNNQRYRSQDQLRSTSIPVFNQDPSTNGSRLPEQHFATTSRTQTKRTIDVHPTSSSSSSAAATTSAKQFAETMRKDISNLPNLFPGSVGLSNPPSTHKPQVPPSPELKRKFSGDNVIKKPTRPQHTIIESTILPVSNTTKQQIFSTTTEIIPNVNHDRVDSQNKTPQTPTFPVTNQTYNQTNQTRVGNSSYRNQEETSRRSSVSSAAESDLLRNGAYQVHNVSQFWYKEKMSREDAINMLKNKPPGAFLVRDSQGFPGSYGLAVKVETLPQGIQPKQGADPNAELVRHYLIERTPTGHVRLKGCPNEPDFSNLSALVYQHSVTPLALPLKLVIPVADMTEDYRTNGHQSQESTKKLSVKDLLERGAACNVLYLNNVDVESLSGQMAVNKALRATFENPERLQATIVHFKVSSTGITLSDNKKKLFSRRHFPKEYVTYCGVDYEADRYWSYQYSDLEMLPKAKCFAFVSKKINGNTRSNQPENECHIFAEIDRTQPSTAIVNFVSKVMIGSVPV